MTISTQEPVAHVRLEGKSYDVPLSVLDVSATSSHREIQRAVARYLEISDLRLRDTVIDRHPSGNLTLRPQAVFG